MASNVFAVVRAALAEAQRRQPDEKIAQMSLSDFSIVEEIRTVHRGMNMVLDDAHWRRFQTMPEPQLAKSLLRWTKHVDWVPLRKAVRGPKVTRKRTRYLDTPHVSTARLLGRA